MLFLALYEEFKSCIDTQSLSEFLESVNDLSADTLANQTFMYTEFEVRIIIANSMCKLKRNIHANKLR